MAKDVGFTYPFAANPHLLVTGRYSGSTDNNHELVFRHDFPAGQAATRELLQSCRTAAHPTIIQRMGINLLYTDAIGDTVTSVTRKAEKQQGSGLSQATNGFASRAQGHQHQPMSSSVHNTTTRTHKQVA